VRNARMFSTWWMGRGIFGAVAMGISFKVAPERRVRKEGPATAYKKSVGCDFYVSSPCRGDATGKTAFVLARRKDSSFKFVAF
jgi:hypothetical protein